MALSLFSRLRTVGVALTLAVLVACGGGGGGGDTNPPPPPVDTDPPGVKSWTPVDGATDIDIDQGVVTITVVMDEAIECPAQNPIVITRSNGQAVEGGTFACDPPTLSLTFQAKFLLQCETYKATLVKGIKDLAGNQSVEASVSFSTKCPPPVKKVYSVSYNATAGQNSLFGIDTADGVVGGAMPLADMSFQVAVLADAKNHTVWTASSRNGVNTYDTETGVSAKVSVGGHMSSFALKGEYVWAAADGLWRDGAFYDNRLFKFDRVTREAIGQTEPVTDSGKTPLMVLAHPTAARLYTLNVDAESIHGTNCTPVCREVRLPGYPGTVTAVDSASGAILWTVTVGSVPLDGYIDATTNTLYVVNAGDRTLSKVNLTTQAVTTASLPEFTGYRQPVGIARLGDMLCVSNYLDSLSCYDSNMSLAGTVTLPALSVPTTMVSLDGKLYVTLQGADAVAEILTDFSVSQTFAVGRFPSGITAFDSGSTE